MTINPKKEILDNIMGERSQIQEELLNIEDSLFYNVQDLCKRNKLLKYLQEFAYLTNEFSALLVNSKFIYKEMYGYKPIIDEMKLLELAIDGGVQEIVFYGKDKKRYSISSEYVIDYIVSKLIGIEGKEEQKRRMENSEMLELIGAKKAVKKIVKKVVSDWDFTRTSAREYFYYFVSLIIISLEGKEKPSKDSIYRIIYDFYLLANFFTGNEASKEASIKKLMGFYKSKG